MTPVAGRESHTQESKSRPPATKGQVTMMQALVFRYSMPRFAFARLVGMLTPRAYLSAWGPTGLQELPEPRLLGSDWAIVRTARCGICGSDAKQVFLNASFDNPLRDLVTFPQDLGHEAVGVIERVGPGVRTRRVGGGARECTASCFRTQPAAARGGWARPILPDHPQIPSGAVPGGFPRPAQQSRAQRGQSSVRLWVGVGCL
jgi:hypothetical protein